MIKQKYNYSFFYDNYKYRHHNMFRNYYDKLEKQYKYFILAKRDINKHDVDVYRSNKNIDDILKEIDSMDYMSVEIQCVQNKFPEVAKYLYIHVDDFKQVTKIYQNNLSETRRMNNDELIWMRYANYNKHTATALIDNSGYIRISYNGYTIAYRKENGITVHKSVPLSPGMHMKYNSDHKEMVEKVLKRILKDNINGFYDEMISKIKNGFGIR